MWLKRIPSALIPRSAEIVEIISEHLQQCTSMRSLKQVHAPMITSGLHRENYFSVKLVTLSTKVMGDITYARMIFDCFFDTKNVFLWTSMIAAYAGQQSQDTVEAIFIYRKMQRHMVRPNSFTLSSVLKVCSFLLAIQVGRQIHGHSVKLGLNSDPYVQTTLVDMYAKFGCIKSATYLFETMSERNIVVCNAMIMCYTKAGNVEAAQKIFDNMTNRDCISWTAMISGYSNHGNMQAAQDLFYLMPERDASSWNALIMGYSKSGEWHRALVLFNEMQLENVKPDPVTMAVIISVCGHIGALETATQIHDYVKNKGGVILNVHVFNALIDMYAKCGSVDKAHQIFCEMPFKDIVSYNSMIAGFANHGHAEDALKLFSELVRYGLQPDAVTFVGVLTACSHAGLLDLGCKFFNCMTRHYRIEPLVDHYSCIVDLLGRAGLVQKAYELIKVMKVEPHAGVWGALLAACRTYCNVEVGKIAAKELFKMEPANPGNYVLLSNIYARANMWDDVSKVRHWMRRTGVAKTDGCSWIEIDGVFSNS
ncbi:pentatricopeptide repeat-containing protein At3g29230-like [Telopea speciosissima]|uniref:pentatricopeptide repeat-containing protein At3g29230-like n=1 Tax=Telopea speciosissima TaxID=54955 RepID=UPI001CC68F00|nr:pentatricopeptide repeat-containing protein At3g29230-like [Telopea speciosissima]